MNKEIEIVVRIKPAYPKFSISVNGCERVNGSTSRPHFIESVLYDVKKIINQELSKGNLIFEERESKT